MNECHDICDLHAAFSVECTGQAEVRVAVQGYLTPPRSVLMCTACADWWHQADPTGAHIAMQESMTGEPLLPYFAATAFYDAVIRVRNVRGITNNAVISEQAGLSGASALTRIKQGGCPDVNTLVRLLVWMGNADVSPYIRYEEPR